MLRTLIAVGTRPEALKLIPLYKALIKAHIDTHLCATFQHDFLLKQVFELFSIIPNSNLSVMQMEQTLESITTTVITRITPIMRRYAPDVVIVQGDTTTAFATALAAFYQKIPVAHVEAGLRTLTSNEPFPEEMNRRLISKLATYHFAPTDSNVANLVKEGIDPRTVACTGNTIVDTLRLIQGHIESRALVISHQLQDIITETEITSKKIIILTAHRRESFGQGLIHIFNAIIHFANRHHDAIIVYPVHPNPSIAKALEQTGVKKIPNILCLEPLPYHEMVFLMSKAHLIVTDSGGMQEEATSLGKKILILRNATERLETVTAGFAHLIGTNEQTICNALEHFYNDTKIMIPSSIYGNGDASLQIVNHLQTFTKNNFVANNRIPMKKGIL